MKSDNIDFYKIDYILDIKTLTNDYEKIFGDYILNEPTKTFVESLINKYYDYLYDKSIKTDENNDNNKVYINKLLNMFPNKDSKLYKDLEACIYDNNKFGVLADDFFRLSSCKNVDLDINKS